MIKKRDFINKNVCLNLKKNTLVTEFLFQVSDTEDKFKDLS